MLVPSQIHFPSLRISVSIKQSTGYDNKTYIYCEGEAQLLKIKHSNYEVYQAQNKIKARLVYILKNIILYYFNNSS
jgi:hypothetical protein